MRLVKRSSLFALLLSAALGVAGPAPHARAQPCEPEWMPIDGLNDGVLALAVWDPDGTGPAAAQIVAGGAFTFAGGLQVNHIAAWDPAARKWSALGAGMNGPVLALAAMPNGDLIAGGRFTQAGGAEDAHWVARWDGERWEAMDGGMRDGVVYFEFLGGHPGVHALAVSPGGELFAGGNFTRAGDATAIHIARWDGSAWQPVNVGVSWHGTVFSLAFLPSGVLVAGGYFDDAGGVAAKSVAQWDGAMWRPLGSGLETFGWPGSTGVWAVATSARGEIFAGGPIVSAGGVPIDGGVARWDGDQWRSLGDGPGYFFVSATLARPDGTVFAGARSGIARWDAESWTELYGAEAGYALATLPNGDVIAGGRFSIDGETSHLAIWGCRECYADCDGDGSLAFLDFLCFQGLFAAADPGADCDCDTAFTFFDFLCFQNAFAGGCP